MSVISFKEASMLLIGLGLIYGLYFLKNNDELFVTTHIQPIDRIEETKTTETTDTKPEMQPNVLPEAVLETVQIPDWLANKEDYDLNNFTADDLLQLAKVSHQEDHDFFPENQNTLVYLLKAKELGLESEEIEELLTEVHASLYDQADQAIRNYDANTLTALTARLKSIKADDPNIQQYTNQISLIYTLDRLTTEITEYMASDLLYTDDKNDAIHTWLIAAKMDGDYPPLLTLKIQLLESIKQKALRAAQELDFSIAGDYTNILLEIDSNHDITTQTIYEIQAQKQNRFAYLDQQFYTAINNLNLSRAENLIEELNELEIAAEQINGYQGLLKKTQTFGPYEIADEFNDLLEDGFSGPTMVVMPTGTFYMGSQTGPKHQRPRHLVNINYGFAVSRTEITVGDFRAFITATQYVTTAERLNRAKIYDEGTGRFKEKNNINWQHNYIGKTASDDLPVIHVSWDDAHAYVNWLKDSSGEQYRLLSESEFEYLLKGNSDNIYPWGNDSPTQIWGNFSGAKDKPRRSRIKWREGFVDYEDGYWGPAPVASFISTLTGLYDLSGNVMEWTADCWHDSYTRAPNDGSAWVNRGCEYRVIRGGSWSSANEEYQVSHRVQAENELTDPRIGFRIAKTFNF